MSDTGSPGEISKTFPRSSLDCVTVCFTSLPCNLFDVQLLIMVDKPTDFFLTFAAAMRSFPDFDRADSKESRPYDAWKNLPLPPKQTRPRKHAMADHPKIIAGNRKYCMIEKRTVFECGTDRDGLVVQLEIHETPAGQRRAAVYVQSKDFPPSARNIGNITFKFVQAGADFIVEVRQDDAVKALTKRQPSWLQRSDLHPVPSGGKLLVRLGPEVNSKFVQRLLLLADFCGQARAHFKVKAERNTNNFHVPSLGAVRV